MTPSSISIAPFCLESIGTNSSKIDDEMSKFLVYAVLFCCLINPICSIVELKSISASFPDNPALFSSHSRGFNGSSICGGLRLADPLDACSPLLNEVEHSNGDSATIALIVRGKCAFEEKIRNAQEAGFDAAIVYDDKHHRNLISMMGSPEGIWIYAVFVSNTAGEILRENAKGVGDECCIIRFIDKTAWTVMVISIISVVAVISLVGTILFTVNYWRNHQETRRNHQETRRNHQETRRVVDDKIVDMLPSVTFGSENLIGRVGETCTICLEDYKHGENLKILPCRHDFHASCVDSWLTKWATFCPVCKHDMRTYIASSIK